MTLAIQAMLAMIEQVLPMLTGAANVALVDSIISTLSGFLPFIVQEVETLGPPIRNIIAALSANPATNAAQAATLSTLDKQVDDAFDAAATDTDADT